MAIAVKERRNVPEPLRNWRTHKRTFMGSLPTPTPSALVVRGNRQLVTSPSFVRSFGRRLPCLSIVGRLTWPLDTPHWITILTILRFYAGITVTFRAFQRSYNIEASTIN